ncbi:MAG: UDP-N-acetylmuramate--L-alanine ligase [Eubacteriales bacterium]|jgi:UDP-N-acetylmuramate--alanine ligase|nr:UDP-N-acetylmuramate--L-alanine ligase [Clostridiales bacterium]
MTEMTDSEILAYISSGSRIFFIGIGGISMHALALICADRGAIVSGYDRTPTAITDKLIERGIKVRFEHTGEFYGAELAVYTSAIHPDNEEWIDAERQGIPLVRRAEFLGALMSEYKYRIGVGGMHGKSTCTSMVSHIFIEAGTNPTIVSGAESIELGSAYRLGGDEYFIFEADEYTDSFLSFCPTTAVALNIELDHIDYFTGIEHIVRSFTRFLSYAERAVVNIDSENVRRATKKYTGELITYGLESPDAIYTAEDITFERGAARFTLCERGSEIVRVALAAPGRHNIYNALAASAVALAHGIGADKIAAALATFKGAKRRFEYRDTLACGAELYDDYAHHPTEIRASIDAALKVADGRLWIVYQPHTYSRTAGLFDEFCAAFEALRPDDRVIFADIYAAREENIWGVSSGQLAERTRGALYVGGFGEIAQFLRENLEPGDTVITMGAGDIYKVGDMLLGNV